MCACDDVEHERIGLLPFAKFGSDGIETERRFFVFFVDYNGIDGGWRYTWGIPNGIDGEDV